MEKLIYDESNGLYYELVDNYYLPCLKAPDSPKVGRFGMMYHNYLRKHKKVTYSGLMLSGKLKEHLKDIDRQAEEMFAKIIKDLAEKEGVTEQLKATDQLKWVGLMNNIRNRAEEIVMSEMLLT